MSDDEHGFEDAFRKLAEGVSDSFERAQRGEYDGLARMIGVDPDVARRWAADAHDWLQEQRTRFETSSDAPRSAPVSDDDDPVTSEPEPAVTSFGPDPRDLPTEEQGQALAAISSGRWTIEPGTSMLVSHGDGPGPNNALGLVRELRVRDWIDADGAVTVAGRRALERWLS
jgi:hypothetical protein